MEVNERAFGSANGVPVTAHTVANANGYSFTVMNYGATLISFLAPEKDGTPTEITLGYDEIEPYIEGHPFLGSTVGRVANRIGGATYSHDGRTYQLDVNEGSNMLHGGSGGFHQKIWSTRTFERSDQAGVILHVVSEAGDQGFPGTVGATVTYSLTESNQFVIEYRAESDVETPLNLTNHTYWNLAGAPDLRRIAGDPVPDDGSQGAIRDHILFLNGSIYVEQGAGQIPTGRLIDGAGTPLDFRTQKPIGRDVVAADGYDHCFVLDPCEEPLCLAAVVLEPVSGRRMEISTTYPAIQFYTSEKLDGTSARRGQTWRRRDAFCLETQFHPDALNHDNFPSIMLQPEETYQHKTVHAFTLE